MILAVTGHRPNKLPGGYDNNSPANLALRKVMRNSIVKLNPELCISGMALGIDTLFALETLDVNIPLECAIPCREQDKIWTSESKKTYRDILSKASIVTLVTDKPYSPKLMQIRNEYMVDKCNVLLAFWDGSDGGTKNCVNYAKRCNKKIYIYNPIICRWM